MPSPFASPLSREQKFRRLVEECFRREAGSSAPVPEDRVDLLQSGILDSMGWVSFLRAVETASGIPEIGSGLHDGPASFAAVLAELSRAVLPALPRESLDLPSGSDSQARSAVIAGSSAAFGARVIPSEEVDRAFGMTSGKLRRRAGIVSLAYADDKENELTLGTRAARAAMLAGSCHAQKLDWIIATSETHRDYPSLSSLLHAQLLARENCAALDVGGACLGVINALAVAQSLLVSGQAKTIVVVSADVHSCTLRAGRVAGEFGGLFGDGASAFLLRCSQEADPAPGFKLGQFLFGCASQYAAAIQVKDAKDGEIFLKFDGEALSRAAITRLEKVLSAVELRSSISRSAVGGFATHQPNPRLVALLAKQLKVAEELFPPIARDRGNLGSSTCGAALHTALHEQWKHPAAARQPIFLASLGPGLLFGGGWLSPVP